MNTKSLNPNQRKKFNKLYREVKSKIKSLDKVETEVYAAHFYQNLELHKKYIKDGTYNEFFVIFRALIDGRVQNTLVHKDLGQYGIYLLTKLHPWEELDELDLIETVVCFKNLIGYFKENILGETKK